MLDAADEVREAYRPLALPAANRARLVTKVILGTLGCLPACDRYVIDGFRHEHLSYSRANRNFVGRILRLCRENLDILLTEQKCIASHSGKHYPLTNLVDMHFWQIGYELESRKASRPRKERDQPGEDSDW
jgi:hypothetical protein